MPLVGWLVLLVLCWPPFSGAIQVAELVGFAHSQFLLLADYFQAFAKGFLPARAGYDSISLLTHHSSTVCNRCWCGDGAPGVGMLGSAAGGGESAESSKTHLRRVLMLILRYLRNLLAVRLKAAWWRSKIRQKNLLKTDNQKLKQLKMRRDYVET